MGINKESLVPLYSQIEEIFEKKIISNEWSEGYKLPSENELAKMYAVSNITIKRALHELVEKNMLRRIRGKGTFVSSKQKDENIYNLVTFGSEQNGSHKLISSSIIKAGTAIGEKFKISPDRLVINIQRVKEENGIPVAIDNSYLLYSVFKKLSQTKIEDEKLYDYIQNNIDIKFNKAKIYFSTKLANGEESCLLNVNQKSPLVVLERLSYLEDEIVEYSKFVVRQDKANYYLEVTPN